MVPYPQTLTIHLTTQREEDDDDTSVLIFGTGWTTTGGLWAVEDNKIDNVFELTLLALNHEAENSIYCLNFYCNEEPTKEIKVESNGTCKWRAAASGVYGYADNDPTVSFIVANKGPNFMHVYAALPVGEGENATYYILNPTHYQDGYIQAIALRALSDGTNVTLVPSTAVKIFRPHKPTLQLITETTEAYDEVVLSFSALETVWVEVEVTSCDSAVSLSGTVIESSYELAVFSSKALCNNTAPVNKTGASNETTNWPTDSTDSVSEALSFGYILNPLHQLPPVSRWGSCYVVDLSPFSNSDEEIYVVSFSILSATQSDVSITCYSREVTVCKASKLLGKGETWHYELNLKTLLNAEVVFIEGSSPVMVLSEVFSQRNEEVYHSEMLQPTEWFLKKQTVPILHSLGSSQHQTFDVNLVVPGNAVTVERVMVWDNRNNESMLPINDYKLITSYSLAIVRNYTFIRIVLDPTAGHDYILQFRITGATPGEDNVKFGASVFSFGGYAYSNGYVQGMLHT